MSTASHPANLTLSAEKFRIAQAKPNFLFRLLAGLANIPLRTDMFTQQDAESCLRDGDARAAVVVQSHPCIVAAYSDEFDAVILLRIPSDQLSDMAVQVRQRLVAVFNYVHAPYSPRDIVPGERQLGNFYNVETLIGDLLSDDSERLEELKQEISEQEWLDAEKLGRMRLDSSGLYRWHRPGSTRTIAGDTAKAIVVALFALLLLVVILWKFA